jgi:hypothetical protein
MDALRRDVELREAIKRWNRDGDDPQWLMLSNKSKINVLLLVVLVGKLVGFEFESPIK